MTDRNKGNIFLLTTAIMWGTGFIAQKLGGETMPPLCFNALRQTIAAILLLPVLYGSIKRSGYLSRTANAPEMLALRKRKAVKSFFICGFFLSLGTCFQQVGLQTVTAGKSGFISSLYIVIVPVIGVAFGQRSGFKKVACVFMAVCGFALLSLRGGLGGTTAGDWLTLISAFAFAAQVFSVDRMVDEGNSILVSVLQLLFCTVFVLPVAILLEQPTMEQISTSMLAVLYSAVVSTAGGYTLQIVGQKYTAASTAALIMSLESVFAALFGALWLSEMMSLRELLGCAVILAATVLDQIDVKELLASRGKPGDAA